MLVYVNLAYIVGYDYRLNCTGPAPYRSHIVLFHVFDVQKY